LKHLWALIRKEWLVEWRHKNSAAGILLYVLATVFISYLSVAEWLSAHTWNALFWIIMVFAAVTAIARSFISESRGLQLFYFMVTDAQSYILSKIIFNSFFLLVVGMFCFLFYSLLLGHPVQDTGMYLVGVVSGSMAFASVLTLISAIAARANNSVTLMAILGIPLLLPLLIMVIRFSRNAMDGLAWSVNGQYLLLMIAVQLLAMALSYLLFPYLWRD
jgi:heme exporter protein B